MEGMRPQSRLAEFAAAHRDISFCRVEGILYAWIPGWCAAVGQLAHGDTEDELLGKLTAALGG